MKTIVKGKNMKNNYERVNDDSFYLVRNFLTESDPIKDIQNRLHHESFTSIKTIPKFVSHDIYATLYDLDYRLNIGEEYEGDIIENIEGTKDGDIVYIEDPNDRHYNMLTDESHPRQHKISLEEVKIGWWVLELL